MFELEIETGLTELFLNVGTLFMCFMLEDQLLKEEESSLVVNSLPNLDLSHPQMGCPSFLTIWTLQVFHNEFDNKCLLQKSSSHNFLLNSQLDLESLGMLLRPNEACINQLKSLQTSALLEAEGKELL